MGKENIEQYSARYSLVKAIAGFWHNKVFYRKVIVIGNENINPDHHIIYAPNHQNALMDALAVLFTQKKPLIFLARADIFKKKLIAPILYFFKILPVYRIRDGFRSLKGNDEIFDKTLDVLKNKINSLVILPEGDHASYRRLRQLKKGICRVALQSDEATGFSLKIKIIPVGLEYSNYTRFRQVLTVVYGKPIEVSDFFELYKESPEKALNELRSRLSTEMKKLMVHIESEEDYEAIDELRTLINGKFRDDIKHPKVFKDRILIDKLNRLKSANSNLYKKICSLSLQIKEKVKELDTDYRFLEKRDYPVAWLIAGIIGIIISFPLFLYGNIFNFVILEIPNFQIRKVRDSHFHSSVRYALSLILAFIFLPAYLIISVLITSSWWVGVIIFLTLPLTGLFAWYYSRQFREILGAFKVRKLLKNNNKDFTQLRNNHSELINLVSNI